MSLKRECDRCHHLTLVDSSNGQDFRTVRIERGATASSNGGASTIYKSYDFCKACLLLLERWIEKAPSEAT